jgi:RNA-directed DNA polymerase
VADKAIEKLKTTIRELTRRTRGHRLVDIVHELKTALTGGKACFGIAEVLSPLREIDKWVRRRLPCCAWKQWGSAGYCELTKRGVSVREAGNTSKSAHGPWRLSRTPALSLALPAKLFRQMGLPELAPARAASDQFQGTAGYVTRMSGGVGGRGREAPSYPDFCVAFSECAAVPASARAW